MMMKALALATGFLLGSSWTSADAQCDTCDLGTAGLTSADFVVTGEFEEIVKVTWSVPLMSTITEVRIFADAEMIHSEQGTPVFDEGDYDWDWCARGELAKTYCLTIHTDATGSFTCGYDEEMDLCPPARVIATSGPNQTGLDLPNDEFFPSQWALHNLNVQKNTRNDIDIDAPQAWAIEAGHPDVIVAIGDHGIDWHHVDLYRRMVPGFSWGRYTDALAATGSPLDPTIVQSAADVGGFDPFACIGVPPSDPIPPDCFGSVATTCPRPDWTWQPDICYIQGELLAQLYDPDTDQPYDPAIDPPTFNSNSHATKIAGIIAGERNNGLGVAGIAGGRDATDGVRLLPLEIANWARDGAHPGVLADGTYWFYPTPTPSPPSDDVILTAAVGPGGGFDDQIDSVSSCLEYVTYMREHLDVNIRVITFQTPGFYLSDPPQPQLEARFNRAVNCAWEAGIFIISASNDDGCLGPGVPTNNHDIALHPKVFAVGDLTWGDVLSWESSCGESACDPRYCGEAVTVGDCQTSPCSGATLCGNTIAAPGSQHVKCVIEGDGDTDAVPRDQCTENFRPQQVGGFGTQNEYEAHECGCSYAAPVVAGVAALLFSYHHRFATYTGPSPNPYPVAPIYQTTFGPAQVWQILVDSAVGLPVCDPVLKDTRLYGAGRVNAYHALLMLRGQPYVPGDLDADCDVDMADWAILDGFLGNGPGPTAVPGCTMDVNIDGVIDSKDANALRSYVNTGFPDLLVRPTCF